MPDRAKDLDRLEQIGAGIGVERRNRLGSLVGLGPNHDERAVGFAIPVQKRTGKHQIVSQPVKKGQMIRAGRLPGFKTASPVGTYQRKKHLHPSCLSGRVINMSTTA